MEAFFGRMSNRENQCLPEPVEVMVVDIFNWSGKHPHMPGNLTAELNKTKIFERGGERFGEGGKLLERFPRPLNIISFHS